MRYFHFHILRHVPSLSSCVVLVNHRPFMQCPYCFTYISSYIHVNPLITLNLHLLSPLNSCTFTINSPGSGHSRGERKANQFLNYINRYHGSVTIYNSPIAIHIRGVGYPSCHTDKIGYVYTHTLVYVLTVCHHTVLLTPIWSTAGPAPMGRHDNNRVRGQSS